MDSPKTKFQQPTLLIKNNNSYMSNLMFIRELEPHERSIAWYDMGTWEQGETTLIDHSGNGNNINVYGNPVFNADQGGKMIFDGVDDYCDGQINCEITNGTMTFEMWIKPHSYAPSTWTQYILYGSRLSGTSRLFSGIRKVNANQVISTIYQNSPSINESYLQPMTDGVWHHIVMVRNSIDTKTYIDGVLERTDSNVGTFIDSLWTNRNITLGIKDNPLPEGFLQFETTITRFYNIELSGSEVLTNYNNELGRHS